MIGLCWFVMDELVRMNHLCAGPLDIPGSGYTCNRGFELTVICTPISSIVSNNIILKCTIGNSAEPYQVIWLIDWFKETLLNFQADDIIVESFNIDNERFIKW